MELLRVHIKFAANQQWERERERVKERRTDRQRQLERRDVASESLL